MRRAAAGAAIGSSLLLGGCSTSSLAGPTLIGEYDGLVWYDSFDVGTEFTAGQIALVNESDHEMTIVAVDPVMRSGSELTFLGAYLAGDDKEYALTDRLVEYPPSDAWGSFSAAVGGVVPPSADLRYSETGTELMLAFSVDGGTRGEMLAVEVTYEVEGVRKKERIETGLVVCVPAGVECAEDEGA